MPIPEKKLLTTRGMKITQANIYVSKLSWFYNQTTGSDIINDEWQTH